MTVSFEDTLRGTAVAVREVGMREGLQSDPTVLSTEQKRELFRGLVEAGCREINAVSFVSPKRMPHMADAEALLRSLGDLRTGIDISGLVPNERGLDRALVMAREGLLDTIFLVFMDSEAGLSANGMTASREQLLAQIARSAVTAQQEGLRVVVFISLAFGSSIDGWMDPQRVVTAAEEISRIDGVDELILSDSVGHADPLQVHRLLGRLADVLPTDRRIGLHLHDTRGAGLANVVAALASPFRSIVLDAAFGGWGGDYPFIPEAYGNIASEDLLEMLHGMGVVHGIDVERIMAVASQYASISGRDIDARLHKAGPVTWKHEAAVTAGGRTA
jgi:isopropylmalate/homocitrate/citramalate synthase